MVEYSFMNVMKLTHYIYAGCLATSLLSGCCETNESTVPVELRTEYLSNPIGLDQSHPRFTWEYDGHERDFQISKYEIRIGTDPAQLQPYTKTMRLLPHTRYYWTVTVWDQKGRECETSKVATFETAKFALSDWTASWITDQHDQEFEPAPLFRKAFALRKEVKEARLYVASAGYHELFINGNRVGSNFLDPGYTHFDKRILYVTHDVTNLLQKGTNAVVAVLGNGWYNEQSVATWNFHKARWRNRPRLLCELRVTYVDGSQELIGTDETWKTSTGAYTYNNIYSGDRFDARLEETGWKLADFKDGHWTAAVTVKAPALIMDAQQMPGIRVTEEFKPVAMKKFSDHLYVYSFPKNMAGFCRLKVKGEPGTHITLKHGELLKNNGRLEQGNINVYYYPEKSGEVFQMDEFTLKGIGEEVFMPSFTYHGFQYVEVESDRPITLTEENLTALFLHTDVKPVGSFLCSNPLLNKIWKATMQAYRSNLHSIPTDCPQREKNGWTADAHIAIDLGLLGFDGITLYEKWMRDVKDNQRAIGDISGIIPADTWGYDWPGPIWDAVMFVIPNALYAYYGEMRSIEQLYPTMQRYLDFLKTKEKEGYLTHGLGDWVTWKATTNSEYTSTAYYYLDCTLMARFAKLLGKDATPYQAKADTLKALINKKFFHPETGIYAEGTQTAQALALYLNLVPDGKETLVAEQLHKVVSGNDYFLNYGLVGSKTVPSMLTKYGYVEDAMKMVTKTEAPSWGYWVETMGFQTLPETWTLSPEFRDASLNHVFMGDVSAWMMNQLAGINHAAPGFKKIRITPHFVKDLDWVKGEYHSIRGRIVSEWKRVGDEVTLAVTIPADCTAEIVVNEDVQCVGSGSYTFSYKD